MEQTVDDMHELAKYLRRLDQLRRDEASLPTPISLGKGFDHQRRMAGEVALVATRCVRLSSNSRWGTSSHIHVDPQGLLYDHCQADCWCPGCVGPLGPA